jgi:hypothetical protein
LEHGQLFSKEKILGHQGSARGKEQPDERQQLRILQELAFLPAVRTEFLRSTGSRGGEQRRDSCQSGDRPAASAV